jgi:isopentenyldiphosphate isomerase
VFDIYNEQGQLIGQEKRAVVHKLGLLHKAVYCFVFNPQGQLLTQQRSQHKKIGPGQWDLSVAEHLSPGEDPAPTQCPQDAQQQHQLRVSNHCHQQP